MIPMPGMEIPAIHLSWVHFRSDLLPRVETSEGSCCGLVGKALKPPTAGFCLQAWDPQAYHQGWASVAMQGCVSPGLTGSGQGGQKESGGR